MSKPMVAGGEIEIGSDEFIVSKTDLKGMITYCNEIFIKISGYCEEELLDSPHNIVRHPDMPKAVFKLLWQKIQNGEEVFAYVKNLSKDGSYYWVFANITASLDGSSNKIIGYYSVRIKPNKSAIKTISSLYAKMVEIEKSEGVEGSTRYLNRLLEDKGVCYDEFVISLQG